VGGITTFWRRGGKRNTAKPIAIAGSKENMLNGIRGDSSRGEKGSWICRVRYVIRFFINLAGNYLAEKGQIAETSSNAKKLFGNLKNASGGRKGKVGKVSSP